jgi:hypothetical protein
MIDNVKTYFKNIYLTDYSSTLPIVPIYIFDKKAYFIN